LVDLKILGCFWGEGGRKEGKEERRKEGRKEGRNFVYGHYL
jgi:hypothetical protein